MISFYHKKINSYALPFKGKARIARTRDDENRKENKLTFFIFLKSNFRIK